MYRTASSPSLALRSGAQAGMPGGTPKHRWFRFYNYLTTQLAVAAAAAVPINMPAIVIQNDGDFICQQFIATVNNHATGALLPAPDATILVTDAGSTFPLFSGQTPINSICGTAQLPFLLPQPYRFLKNSSVTVTYQNNDPALVHDVYFSLVGYKIFERDMSDAEVAAMSATQLQAPAAQS